MAFPRLDFFAPWLVLGALMLGGLFVPVTGKIQEDLGPFIHTRVVTCESYDFAGLGKIHPFLALRGMAFLAGGAFLFIAAWLQRLARPPRLAPAPARSDRSARRNRPIRPVARPPRGRRQPDRPELARALAQGVLIAGVLGVLLMLAAPGGGGARLRAQLTLVKLQLGLLSMLAVTLAGFCFYVRRSESARGRITIQVAGPLALLLYLGLLVFSAMKFRYLRGSLEEAGVGEYFLLGLSALALLGLMVFCVAALVLVTRGKVSPSTLGRWRRFAWVALGLFAGGQILLAVLLSRQPQWFLPAISALRDLSLVGIPPVLVGTGLLALLLEKETPTEARPTTVVAGEGTGAEKAPPAPDGKDP